MRWKYYHKELLGTLKSTRNNKSFMNDGLAKEFYETFWDSLEEFNTHLFKNKN